MTENPSRGWQSSSPGFKFILHPIKRPGDLPFGKSPDHHVPVLLSLGSSHGASTGASTAIQALISIDNILAVAFANRIDRASIDASATADAIIIDRISHYDKPPFIFLQFSTKKLKNQ
jgi:hypothetical protein